MTDIQRLTLCKLCIAGLGLALSSEPRLTYSVIKSSCIPEESKHADIKHYINYYSSGKVYKFEEQAAVLIKPIQTVPSQRALSAPVVHKLPYEILGEIFSRATQNTEGIDMTSDLGVWAMRNVCERWRDIVDGTPRLWSKFTYDRYLHNFEKPRLIMRTRMCLQFSRSSLLSISVMPGRNPTTRPGTNRQNWASRAHAYLHERSPTDYVFPNKIFEDLVRHADRWYSISIDLDVINNSSPSTLTKQIAFNNLKVMHLYDPHGPLSRSSAEVYGAKRSKCAFNFFTQANELEDVTLEDVIVRDDDDFVFKWLNVKTLNMFSTRKFAQYYPRTLLNCMPNLENFTSYGKFYQSSRMLTESIQVPSLRNLCTDSGEFICKRISVPHLTGFKLSNNCFHYLPEFQATIEQSKCSLKRVNVILCHQSSAVQFLKSLPEVEDLKLSMRYVQYGMGNLECLSWSPKKKLLPCLKILVLDIDILDSKKIGDVLQTVTEIVLSRSLDTAGTPCKLSLVKCTLKFQINHPHTVDLSGITSIEKALGINVEVNFEQLSSLTYCEYDDDYYDSDLGD